MIEAFPLHWPYGYKRTETRIKSKFKTTMDVAQHFLREELRRMGTTDVIVSTNVPVRNDGMLYSDWMKRKLDDTGVAIYFKYKGKDVSMCCDQYDKVWENVYALAKGIEALRGMERWGVSEFLERAFTGFKSLPESAESTMKTWYEILEVSQQATQEEIRQAYFKKAKDTHPDNGGTSEQFNIIHRAYLQASNTKAISSQ